MSETPRPSITMHCPAKVNLALSVGPPDSQAMHPLVSWMVTTQFGDTLSLWPSTALANAPGASSDACEQSSTGDQPGHWLTRRWAAEGPTRGAIDWPVEADLAYRAWQLVCEHVGVRLAIDATLTKRIAHGAGLGGGSSDAAAMLVGLNRLFALDLDQATLGDLAGQLGSDVAFIVRAILGEPSAIVAGLGEQVKPTAPPPALDLVLIFPPLQCSTGAVYAAYDQQANTPILDPQRVERLAAKPGVQGGGLFNDLAQAACVVEPRLAEIRQTVERDLGKAVHITGSGSALFVVCDDSTQANEIAGRISRENSLAALATQTQR